MKKWLLFGATAIVVIVCVLYGAYLWMGGASGLIGKVIPKFPRFPEPAKSLHEDQQGEIYFASATPYDLDVILDGMGTAIPTTGVGTLFLPEGASAENPVPGMVILHGSGGIKPGREMEYGQFLADHGIAGFVVNYYAPRGVTEETPYMVAVIAVTEFDAITDAYGALALLCSHPAIDAENIGVMGFSYGGIAARFSLDERIRQVLAPDIPPFALHVDYYGPCFQNLNTPHTTGAPLLCLRGDDDASNELPLCERREQELREAGSLVETHIFPGAGHAWENFQPRELHEKYPYIAGCEVEYDASGHSMLNGEYIVNVPAVTSREERIAIRMASGSVMKDCVKYGYIVGRDERTKAQSDKLLLNFLTKNFTVAPSDIGTDRVGVSSLR